MPKLRRERFVQEYLADPQRNASAAYLRAGYKASLRSARAAAARLLKQRDVRRAIEAARKSDANKFNVGRERIVERLTQIAFADIRKLFGSNGVLKAIPDLDAATAAAIASHEVHETHFVYEANGNLREVEPLELDLTQATLVNRTIKLGMADKRAALDSLVRLQGYAKKSDRGDERDTLRDLLKDILSSPSTLQPVLNPDDNKDDQSSCTRRSMHERHCNS